MESLDFHFFLVHEWCENNADKTLQLSLLRIQYTNYFLVFFFCIRTNFKPKISLHNHLSKPGIYKLKKYSSKSLYRGSSSMTSKSHVRPRGQTTTEQVKENQMTQSFPLNSNWKLVEFNQSIFFITTKYLNFFFWINKKKIQKIFFFYILLHSYI